MANGLLEKSGGMEAMARKNPSRRLGRAEDIAGTVVYLSSRAASHVNGAVVTIDGGEVYARGGMAEMGQDGKAEKSKL